MMRNRSLWIIHARKTVHESSRAQGRFAWVTEVGKSRTAFGKWHAISGGQFHKKVVGMLPINERGLAVGGLAGLKDLGITAFTDGSGFKREHGAQAKGSR